MAIVAVAGGTGQLGRVIVEEIIKRGGTEVLILAREGNDEKAKELGARIVAIDYSNADSIATVLEENKVDTVISTLGVMAGVDPELALIKAADKSTTTKRYIPNTWGIKYTPELAATFPISAMKVAFLNTLEATSLEYTAVINGLFMDYYGQPHVKSYLTPFVVGVDIANNAAAIPGSGDVPVVFSYTFDIGRFVAALLTLPKWNKESYIIGDKFTWNELLQIAEETKSVKFDVKHDSLDTLDKGEVTELPAHLHTYQFLPKEQLQRVLSSFGILSENGSFDFKPTKEQSLNELFPEITTKSIKEIVGAWKGK